jgi:hypothetical protein
MAPPPTPKTPPKNPAAPPSAAVASIRNAAESIQVISRRGPRPHDLRWVVRRAAGLKGQLSRSNTLSSGRRVTDRQVSALEFGGSAY